MSWSNKVVAVTGGSAGLGLEIAKAFHERGARIAILGRDQDRLSAAAAQLGADAVTAVADMTEAEQVQQAVDRIIEQCATIDVWVNNVGVSSRGKALETTPEEFELSLKVNFMSAVHGARAAATHVIQSRGSLVFIGSLASKTASPYLAAYPASKFALAAYAHQLRLELRDEGVHVLHVCPGPIQRNDGGSRYDHQTEALPESAREPGAGVRLKMLDPRWIAARTVAACESRKAEIVLPAKAKWLFALSQLSPNWGDWFLRRSTE